MGALLLEEAWIETEIRGFVSEVEKRWQNYIDHNVAPIGIEPMI